MEFSTAEAEALRKELELKYEDLTVHVIVNLCLNTLNARPIDTWGMRVALAEPVESIRASIFKISSERYPNLPTRIALTVVWAGDPPKGDGIRVSKSSSLGRYTQMYPPNGQTLLRLIKKRNSKDTIRAILEDPPQSHQPTSGPGTGGTTKDQSLNTGVFMAEVFSGRNRQKSDNGTQMTDSKHGTITPKKRKTPNDDRNQGLDRNELYDHGTREGVSEFQGQGTPKKSKQGRRPLDESNHRLPEKDTVPAKGESEDGEIDE